MHEHTQLRHNNEHYISLLSISEQPFEYFGGECVREGMFGRAHTSGGVQSGASRTDFSVFKLCSSLLAAVEDALESSSVDCDFLQFCGAINTSGSLIGSFR